MKKMMGTVFACVVCLGCEAEPRASVEEPAVQSEPVAPAAASKTASEEAVARTTYSVDGMTCVSCANTIRGGVMELEGVKLATVLFADKELVVDWAPGAKPDDDAVVAAVVGLGYEAAVK